MPLWKRVEPHSRMEEWMELKMWLALRTVGSGCAMEELARRANEARFAARIVTSVLTMRFRKLEKHRFS